jgi:NAD(P)-dependent dehydrogenase (short-subunit alcohol dehydrogenase family)
MNVWVVGASGAIGSHCVGALEDNHNVITEHADVRSGHEIADALLSYRPDALVYAAGVNYLQWSLMLDWTEMLQTYDINVVGLIRCLALGATITKCVVIGSDAATRPMRTSLAYNASKAALHAAVKCIARERAGRHFQINVVAPGLIDKSDMTEYVYQRTKELRPELDLDNYMLDQIPMGRPGSPAEVAEIVRWLLEDSPQYLNGSIIEMNGAR